MILGQYGTGDNIDLLTVQFTAWSILSPGQGLRTRAKRTTGKQGLRYTPKPEAPHYYPSLTRDLERVLDQDRTQLHSHARTQCHPYRLYCPQDRGCGHVPNALRANRAYATRLGQSLYCPQDNIYRVYIVPRTGLAQTCKRTEVLQKPP